MWKRFRQGQAERAALKERIRSLEAELAKHKEDGRVRYRRPWLSAGVALLFVAIGFSLGVYSDPIKRIASDALASFVSGGTRSNFESGSSAYRQGDYTTALRVLMPLGEEGDARAQSILGEIYYHSRGVTGNDLEALKWFRLAADQGSAPAQFHLGLMYAESHGLPQDFAEAARWYRLAADHGYPEAMYYLGLAYARGEGVPKNNVSAHLWLNLAAARFPASEIRNRALAVRNRDLVAANMTAVDLVTAQTLAREWKPKQQN
jgi:TPR repeat protein